MTTESPYDITTADVPACESTQELASFLSLYSAALLGAGATCIRLEKNIRRIADAYGRNIEMSIMPRHIHLSLWKTGEQDMVTAIASMRCTPVSFKLNTLLSELSWRIADGRTDFKGACEQLERLLQPEQDRKRVVTLLVACANASFCRLFGGDFMAMLVVGLATLAGYILKTILLEHHTDVRFTVILCSFVSAVLACTDKLFGLGGTPDIAIATSVLYLVPGIPFINSFSDMMYKHYLCAISRFMDAVVLTGCLSIGICAAMLLMHVGMF